MRRLVQRLEKMRKEMREMSIDFVPPSLVFNYAFSNIFLWCLLALWWSFFLSM